VGWIVSCDQGLNKLAYEGRRDDWEGIKVVFLECDEICLDSTLSDLDSQLDSVLSERKLTAKKTTALTMTVIVSDDQTVTEMCSRNFQNRSMTEL
jgi:ABC-type dipeptide/oligopeptide/nickel transport system ATPase subunit